MRRWGEKERPVAGTELYVEDNPVNVEWLRSILQRVPGIRLVVVTDAESGFDAACRERPDLVLLDLNLHNMSGLDAIRRLRSRPETAAIPVLAATAPATTEDVAVGAAAGFGRYATKPIEVKSFLALLGETLAPRRPRRVDKPFPPAYEARHSSQAGGMSPILITGGAGFFGGNFALMAAARGERVVNLDALAYAGNLDALAALKSEPRHVFVEGRIEDGLLVRRLLAELRPRAAINFAAESHVDRSIEDPGAFLRTNITGTPDLISVCTNNCGPYQSLCGRRRQASSPNRLGARGQIARGVGTHRPLVPRQSRQGAGHPVRQIPGRAPRSRQGGGGMSTPRRKGLNLAGGSTTRLAPLGRAGR